MILFTPYVVDFIFKIRKYLSINPLRVKALLVKLQNLDFKKSNKSETGLEKLVKYQKEVCKTENKL